MIAYNPSFHSVPVFFAIVGFLFIFSFAFVISWKGFPFAPIVCLRLPREKDFMRFFQKSQGPGLRTGQQHLKMVKSIDAEGGFLKVNRHLGD
ncbi:MAG: hypothetical protein HFE45_00505 [Oscillospiraceae bacterium]|nr:hypothetical protein [Oscillospiraceae bacterium]